MVKPVLLIRADNNESDQAALTKLGIPSLIDPYLNIRVVEDSKQADQLLSILESSRDPLWLVATSVNAYKYWSQLVGESRLRSAISKHSGVKFAAVGEATASVLRSFGAQDVLVAQDFTGQSLADEMVRRTSTGHALVPGGNIAMKALPSTLTSAGWQVDTAIVYETSNVAREPSSTQLVRDKEVSAVLFRSPSAVRALTHFVPHPEVALIAVGPTTARTLSDQGLEPSAISPNPSAEVVASTIYSIIFQER